MKIRNGNRRDFLKKIGKAAVAVVAVGLTGCKPKGPKRKVRWGMVIDLQRCVLCRSCTVACKQENKTPPGMLYNPVMEEEKGEYPKVSRQWFPRPCMHCEKPACLEACPASVIKKREDGIVYIDPNICVGAKACITACPYNVPIFDDGKQYHDGKGAWGETPSPELGLMQKPAERIFSGKSRKCSFCLHKQNEDGDYVNLPACAKTCMGRAIHFGDLNDPKGELQTLLKTRKNIRLKEEAGTKPNVYYLT